MTDHAPMSYQAPRLLIANRWRAGNAATDNPVVNPATESILDTLSHASECDLNDALEAVSVGFTSWRKVPAQERQRILMKGVDAVRARREEIALTLTLEQGKPIVQARAEIDVAAGMMQWYAEQSKRIYGRTVPASTIDSEYGVRKEPVGPCLLLSPWNMPVVLAARKMAGALSAGCACIVKPPEETPGAVAKVVECLVEAGLPAGALNMVFGVPQDLSKQLLDSDIIRKVSFTGSVGVGKHIAALATQGLKRVTLELGGHAPVIVFDDVDLDACVQQLVAAKFRNAGQLCHAPTRFFIQRNVYARFVDLFAQRAGQLRMGDGIDARTELGPLANQRRQRAISQLVEATKPHATLVCGGQAGLDQGFFFQPTVFADVAAGAAAMVDEPFGPVALIRSFDSPSEVIRLANETRYGLASYVYTDSARLQQQLIEGLDVGAIAINNTLATVAEAPFGGVRDSGYGYESGEEGLESYLHTKFVHKKWQSYEAR